MSDYPRGAPAQQLLLISATPTEQPAIIDLNAAALHFGIPLGTTLGGVPVTRGVACGPANQKEITLFPRA